MKLLKKMMSTVIVGLVFLACGGNSSYNSTNSGQVMAIYNQAYQESFQEDKIVDILESAKDAYVLVDPFVDNITEHIVNIKEKGNVVGGYISVGTGENYRDDFALLEPYLTPIAWAEWLDEFFVSETTTGILALMKFRIDKMSDWGLDWVEFDNMDWLDDETKQIYNLLVTPTEAKSYINALCTYTHSKGMKCMAKNTVEGFENFDGVLYESYDNEKNWWNKEGAKSFLSEGKPVIINHYNEANCDDVYSEYKNLYNENISFICEDRVSKKYKHYNQN